MNEQTSQMFLVVVSSIRNGERLPDKNEYFSNLSAARVAAQNNTRYLSRYDRDQAKVYLIQ